MRCGPLWRPGETAPCAAMADELAQLGWPKVSRATVRRMRARYHSQGLWGLIPRRKPSSATGQADERVVTAILEALRRQRGRSKGTLKGLRELTGQILADTYGPGTVAVPPPSTFNWLARVLADPLEHPGRPARTATAPVAALRTDGGTAPGRACADRHHPPRCDGHRGGRQAGAPGTHDRSRGGDQVGGGGRAARGRHQSRGRRPLLAEMAVPHPARARLARPPAPGPRSPTTDSSHWTADWRSSPAPPPAASSTTGECSSPPRSWPRAQPAPPRSPAAKGAVERTFGSINTLFAQHVAGYTGLMSWHAARQWRTKPGPPWSSCRSCWTNGSPRAGSTAPTRACATLSCPKPP
jgi:hypothetical protein